MEPTNSSPSHDPEAIEPVKSTPPDTPPEPEKTGVDRTQEKPGKELVVLKKDEGKAYERMSATLEAYTLTGIGGPYVPIIVTHERDIEKRFRSVDEERKRTLADLKEMTEKYHEQKNFVIELAAGYLGSIGQTVMITVGAMLAGAAIPECMDPRTFGFGLISSVVGGILLIIGWGLALVDFVRRRSLRK